MTAFLPDFVKIHHVYHILAGLSTAILSVGVYLNLDVLSSGETLDTVLDTFLFYNAILTVLVPALSAMLLIPANLEYFKTGRGFVFVIPALVFTVFTMADYGYIGQVFFQFRKSHGLWRGEFSLTAVLGFVWCFFAVLATVLNYAGVRLIRKYTRVPERRP